MRMNFGKLDLGYLAALISALSFGSAVGAGGAQAAAPAAPARVAELALHRIEKLVILKKVQPTHMSHLRSLTLTALPHSTEEEAAYQLTAMQYAAADGSQSSLRIPLRSDGKALIHAETLGSEPVEAPQWPEQDAITLAENGLHCVQGEILDNDRPQLCVMPELASYLTGFSSLVLSQEKSDSGVIAVLDIRAQGNPAVLRIRLKADGIPVADTPISFISE